MCVRVHVCQTENMNTHEYLMQLPNSNRTFVFVNWSHPEAIVFVSCSRLPKKNRMPSMLSHIYLCVRMREFVMRESTAAPTTITN